MLWIIQAKVRKEWLVKIEDSAYSENEVKQNLEDR